MASEKKTVTRVRMNTLKAAATAVPVKPTKASKMKKVDRVAAALERFAADNPVTKSVAKSKPATAKRTLVDAGLPFHKVRTLVDAGPPVHKVRTAKRTLVDAGLPVHKVRTAAQLVTILSQFPKGALLGPAINADDDLLAVYNMRGRCIAQIQKDMKPGTVYTK